MKQYIWVNTDNGAVLTEESSIYDYQGVCQSVEEAIEFLNDWAEIYGDPDGDWSHIRLREVEVPEDGLDGDEALEYDVDPNGNVVGFEEA